MSIFTSPSPETVGLTCMVAVLLAILLLIILGSIWDYIRRRRARDWDLTSFSEQEKDDGVVTDLGRDWECGRSNEARHTTAHVWDLERRGTSGTKSLSRADGLVGSDCLGRAVPYAAMDGASQRHERQTKQDDIATSTPLPERISSLPLARPQQRQSSLLTPPPAQLPTSHSCSAASPKPVEKLLPQLPLPASEEQHRNQHNISSSALTQLPQTPPHPRSSERNPKPLPLTPWVRSFLPSTPSTLHAQEPEMTWSSSPPTSSTLPSSSPPAQRAFQPQPRKQPGRPSCRVPRSLDPSPGGKDGSVAGHTRLHDPSDSSPTYYFLPLLSPALHPSAGVEGGSGLDGQLRKDEASDAGGEVQYDDDSPTLPPVIDTPTRKTKRRSTTRASRANPPRQTRTTASPTLPPNSLTHTNNPLPPLPLHLATPPPSSAMPTILSSTSTALSTHLAESRTWGRGAGRSDAGGRYNVPRKPLAVRKDTGYLNSLHPDHGGNGNVMTLKGLEVKRERAREKEKMAQRGLRDEDVGRDVEMGTEKENRRPSDITEMEMEFDGEGGEDVTPEDEDDDAEGYVGVGGAGSAGGVRYPKVPRECAMVWSRARGATWD